MSQTMIRRAGAVRGHEWLEETELPEPAEDLQDTWQFERPSGYKVDIFARSQTSTGSSFRDAILAHADRARFEALAALWRSETRFMSSPNQKFMHPAYQEIMAMGRPVLSLLIEDLQKAPNHWFWALRAIVGTDVAAGAQTMLEAADRWIEWYEQA